MRSKARHNPPRASARRVVVVVVVVVVGVGLVSLRARVCVRFARGGDGAGDGGVNHPPRPRVVEAHRWGHVGVRVRRGCAALVWVYADRER